jgi:hypothetical protein
VSRVRISSWVEEDLEMWGEGDMIRLSWTSDEDLDLDLNQRKERKRIPKAEDGAFGTGGDVGIVQQKEFERCQNGSLYQPKTFAIEASCQMIS